MFRLRITMKDGSNRDFYGADQAEVLKIVQSEINGHPEIYIPGEFSHVVEDVTQEHDQKQADLVAAKAARDARLAKFSAIDSVNTVPEMRAAIKAILQELGLI